MFRQASTIYGSADSNRDNEDGIFGSICFPSPFVNHSNSLPFAFVNNRVAMSTVATSPRMDVNSGSMAKYYTSKIGELSEVSFCFGSVRDFLG